MCSFAIIVMGLTGAKVGRNFDMTKFLHTEITESTERDVTNTNRTNDTNIKGLAESADSAEIF